ncbi:transposase [Zwartia vadi]|jgi:hypothetical protein|uniref:transposase n=1 Tax=Zwartia vadi TaxID=3058168 RepID=UPI0025B42BBB|nr:transposase [Zwartia vadi]MDN3988929.1 transposase [Zwartia vadi]
MSPLKTSGEVFTMDQAAPIRLRTRQRYSKEFKDSVITEALQPHVSIAAVALSHGLNANLLRRWIKDSTPSYVGKNQTRLLSVDESSSIQAVPGFLPVNVPGERASKLEGRYIEIEVQKGSLSLRLQWPVELSSACSAWLFKITQ